LVALFLAQESNIHIWACLFAIESEAWDFCLNSEIKPIFCLFTTLIQAFVLDFEHPGEHRRAVNILRNTYKVFKIANYRGMLTYSLATH